MRHEGEQPDKATDSAQESEASRGDHVDDVAKPSFGGVSSRALADLSSSVTAGFGSQLGEIAKLSLSEFGSEIWRIHQTLAASGLTQADSSELDDALTSPLKLLLSLVEELLNKPDSSSWYWICAILVATFVDWCLQLYVYHPQLAQYISGTATLGSYSFGLWKLLNSRRR